MDLLAQLEALSEAIPENRNNLNSYLPFRNKGNSFNYDYVAGRTLGHLLGHVLKKKKYDYAIFQEECLEKLQDLIDEPDFIDHLRQMYFTNNVLSKASPEFLLLTQQNSEKGASAHLLGIFESFLAAYPVSAELESNPNFIEKNLLEVLKNHLEPLSDQQKRSNQSPYLPFIAEHFVKDLQFLCHKTDFLLQNLEQFLELYNFLYCSQLALNIRDWPKGKVPYSKLLFFILDTEKASKDRVKIQNYGYKHLETASGCVFPILSMLEYLNKEKDQVNFSKQPLWKFSQAILQADQETNERVSIAIEAFAQKFFEARKLHITHDDVKPDAIGSLKRLFKYAEDQFAAEKGERGSVRKNYQKEFIKHVAANFMKSGGRNGYALVMNQDYLLLLTNLVIGDERKIHFQRLLHGFEARGVHFDKQSRQSLINFYDRIGNVDRLSDSGEAIYVRSTI